MIYCPHCGRKISNPNATFCPYCGYQMPQNHQPVQKERANQSEQLNNQEKSRPFYQNQTLNNLKQGWHRMDHKSRTTVIIVAVILVLCVIGGIHHETTHYTNSYSFAPVLVGEHLHGNDINCYIHKTSFSVSDDEGDSTTYHVSDITPSDDNNKLEVSTTNGSNFTITFNNDHVYMEPDNDD